MGSRLIVFLCWQLAGALLGWTLSARGLVLPTVLGGMLAGAWAWFAFDFARAGRVLRWLRDGTAQRVLTERGAWGELVGRVRRLLREHKRQLRASDVRLRDFLEAIQASPNGVVLLDARNRIEWCSETAAHHLEIDAERDLGAHLANLVRAPAFVGYLNRRDYRRDVVIDSRGRTGWHASRISLQIHPYSEGRKLLLSRDVTALEQADAMRRDFVANVSHEIRTPLTVVAGFVETLQNVPLEAAEQTRCLQLMAQQTDRMQTLVNDLLALSRLEGSPPPSAGHWVSVPAVMAQVEQESRALAQLLAAESGRPPQPLRFEGGAGCEVAGSEAELRSALVNLANNAVRYTTAHAEPIEVRFELQGSGRAEWSVQDGGPGIAPEHLPRLAERFYRIDRSRSRETGGTGLGLAIAKHVAQRHGGALRIDSMLGVGSRFMLVLPAARVRAGLKEPGKAATVAVADRASAAG